jgi:hypothetical protein
LGWNDLHEPIPGSRDELYDRVTTRGRWLRQRRQMRWVALGVFALLAVAVPAATLVDPERGSSTEVATGAPPDSLFGPPPEGLPEGTAIESPPLDLPFPGTTLAPAPTPTPTTVRRQPSSPTAAPAPAPTPTSMASPPPDPSPAPPTPACTTADVQTTLTPEKPSWAPGEPVKLTLALQNRSDHLCGYNASLMLTGYDASGTPVGLGYSRINEYFFGDLDPISPGQVVSETLEWEHYTCEGSPAACTPLAPGVYRLVAKKGPGTAEATVTLA